MEEIKNGYKKPTKADVRFKNTADVMERQELIVERLEHSEILTNLTGSAQTTLTGQGNKPSSF